jgi:drug/metabolite transporter (DMT)-like permease
MKQRGSIPVSTLLDHTAFLIVSLTMVDSLHFVFARLLLPHFSPSVSTFYITAISTLEMAVIGFLWGGIRFKTLFKNIWFFLSIGFLIGANYTINYEAVAFIDPGTASLLAKATILMSAGLGIFWLREKLTGIQIFGGLTATAGVVVILFQPGDYIRFGSLLVLVSAFMYSMHTGIVKRYGGGLDFMEFFFFRLLSTSVLLFFVAIGRGILVWPSFGTWPLIVLTGSVDVVISRALFYLVLRRIKMSIHSILLTLSPVGAILWSMLLFDTMPSTQQLLGGIAVIAGVLSLSLEPKFELRSH